MSKKSDQDIIAEAIGGHLTEDEAWSDEKHGDHLEKTRRAEFHKQQKASQEKVAAGKAALKIESPNSSGQGKSHLHSEHRFHDVLTKQGYTYSHTTPVIAQNDIVVAYHTYTHEKEFMPKVSVTVHPEKGDAWSAKTKPGPDTKMGARQQELEDYLKGATKRAKSKLRSTYN